MNSFKLLTESLGCSVVKAGLLLHLTPSSARKYATGERTAPEEVIRKGESLFIQIEQAAQAFRPYPDRLGRTTIPRLLHRAIRRRIQEINIIEARKVK